MLMFCVVTRWWEWHSCWCSSARRQIL